MKAVIPVNVRYRGIYRKLRWMSTIPGLDTVQYSASMKAFSSNISDKVPFPGVNNFGGVCSVAHT